MRRNDESDMAVLLTAGPVIYKSEPDLRGRLKELNMGDGAK